MADRASGPARQQAPAQILRYTLDWRDALGWERPGLALSPGRRRIFGATFFGIGMAYGLGADRFPAWVDDAVLRGAFAALALVAYLVLRVFDLRAARQRAKARLPAPIDRTLDIRGDTMREQPSQMSVAVGNIEKIGATRTHAYILSRGHLLIVPARAFPDPAAFQAFTRGWMAAISAHRP